MQILVDALFDKVDWESAGMVSAVGKISAFQPQGPRFDPGFAEI